MILLQSGRNKLIVVLCGEKVVIIRGTVMSVAKAPRNKDEMIEFIRKLPSDIRKTAEEILLKELN